MLSTSPSNPIIYFIHLLHDVLIKFRFFFLSNLITKVVSLNHLKMGHTEPHNTMPSTSPKNWVTKVPQHR
jgi:hypothetical protein